MKVRVRWLGFHDDSWHDSDVFETEKDVLMIRSIDERRKLK